MADIRVLPQSVADKIAAGEVCERPASVCKELVENSIDAGADRITVEIKNGGIKYIRVTDNGCGINAESAETAFLRHATSKLKEIDDLENLLTMGFRGEALASICAVAKVELITKTKEESIGTHLIMEGGIAKERDEIACLDGTTMIVEDLFASIPARMKFMKKDSTEAGYVADVIGRIALSKPSVSIELISDGKEVFKTSGDGVIENAVLKIYGIECAKALCPVNYESNGIRIEGVVGKPEISRGNRTRQTLFVNERYVKNHVVSKIVEEAYKNAVMVGKFPFFILDIKLSPRLVDVNVHPAKTEIKFAYEKEVYDAVYYAVKSALYTEEKPEKKINSELTFEKKSEDFYNAPVPIQVSMDFERKTGHSMKDSGGLTRDINKSYDGVIKNSSDMIKITEKFLEYTVPPKNEEVREEIVKPENKESEIIVSETIAKENTVIEIVEEEKEPLKIIGQIFDTYIMFEQGESVFLVDQHAAHERMRFEVLLKQKQENKSFSQGLLVPVVLDLDPQEKIIVMDNMDYFREYGFEIEDFGQGSFIVSSTPVIGSDKEIISLIFEFIDILKNKKKTGLLSFEERTLDSIACKYAIKANKKLSIAEMEDILSRLEELEKIGIKTCPHGRPIKVELSKYEIEKMFKRIV